MSTTTRRRLTADARRELIEEAALAVFAQRGYHAASMAEIARRSGVTTPVVYDHFASKVELHKRLLARTRDELVAMWAANMAGDEPVARRVPRAVAGWAAYVESHPYAPRVYFHDTTGIPEVQAVHRELQAQARAAFMAMLGREAPPGFDARDLEMAAEIMRSGLTGLGIWWTDHPEVPRERIVEVALAVVWTGLERLVGGGEPPRLTPAGRRPAAPPAAGSSARPTRGGRWPCPARRPA